MGNVYRRIAIQVYIISILLNALLHGWGVLSKKNMLFLSNNIYMYAYGIFGQNKGNQIVMSSTSGVYEKATNNLLWDSNLITTYIRKAFPAVTNKCSVYFKMSLNIIKEKGLRILIFELLICPP